MCGSRQQVGSPLWVLGLREGLDEHTRGNGQCVGAASERAALFGWPVNEHTRERWWVQARLPARLHWVMQAPIGQALLHCTTIKGRCTAQHAGGGGCNPSPGQQVHKWLEGLAVVALPVQVARRLVGGEGQEQVRGECGE